MSDVKKPKSKKETATDVIVDYTNLIEALLFIVGEEGLNPKQLKEAIPNSTIKDTRKLLQNFVIDFNKTNRGIMVMEFKDIFKFVTREEHKAAISKVVTTIKKQRLSAAAMETIAIIAYKQPITKSQVNNIRGTASESVVNTLLLKDLIKELGIANTPGRPVLYGINDKFYDYFNLKSIKDLPDMPEFNDSEGLEEDFDLFASQRADN